MGSSRLLNIQQSVLPGTHVISSNRRLEFETRGRVTASQEEEITVLLSKEPQQLCFISRFLLFSSLLTLSLWLDAEFHRDSPILFNLILCLWWRASVSAGMERASLKKISVTHYYHVSEFDLGRKNKPCSGWKMWWMDRLHWNLKLTQ